MQSAVSLVTAAAVALHLLWGCCGHHACAKPSQAKQVAEAPVKRSCCGHHHSHSAPVEQESPSDQTPADRCDHVDCSFFAAVPQIAPPTIDQVAFGAVPLAPLSVEWNRVDASPLAPPSCRLHLWNGVFLI